MWEKTAIFVAFVALLSGLVNGEKCRDDEEAEQNFVLEKVIKSSISTLISNYLSFPIFRVVHWKVVHLGERSAY